MPSSKYAVQMHSCSPVPSSKYAAHMHSRVAFSAKYKVLISDAGSGSALLTSAVWSRSAIKWFADLQQTVK